MNAVAVPSNSEHVEDLYVLRRRLVFGGGLLISVMVALMALLGVRSDIRDFRAHEWDAFFERQAALNAFLSERDRAYAVTINSSDALWSERRQELMRSGSPAAVRFYGNGAMATVRGPGATSVPWLVLALPDQPLSQHDLSAYLGLIEFYSEFTASTATPRDGKERLALYAYEPQGRLLAVAGLQNEQQLFRILNVSSRAQVFETLLSGPSTLVSKTPGLGPVDSATQGNRLISRLGASPSTGQPVLVDAITQAEGSNPYLYRVALRPLDSLRPLLTTARSEKFLLVAADGSTVLSSGGLTQPDVEALSRWISARGGGAGEEARVGQSIVVLGDLQGIDWSLAHIYGWHDLWSERGASLLWPPAIAVAVILLLWLALRWIDRLVFTPALAGARRIYESNRLNETILDTSPVGLALIAREGGRPLLQNRIAEELARLCPMNVGAALSDSADVGPPCMVSELYRRLAEDAPGLPADGAVRQLVLQWPPDSSGRALEVVMGEVTYLDMPAWVCSMRDVTMQLDLEATLRRAKLDSDRAMEAAEMASQEKTSFVANMSHEIRTPLHGVLGHLELLALTPLQEEQQARLARIRQSADALLNVISDVLDFSKIEAGQLDLEPAEFDLRGTIEQAALLYAPLASGKGIDILLSCEIPPDRWILTDEARLRQIINNLIGNAIKFTESGRVLICVEVDTLDNQESARLALSVSDSGIGLSVEQISRLFQPFRQADASISRRFGGTGLGLALCSRIAEALGGSMAVESTVGVGSMFTLSIPVGLVPRPDPRSGTLAALRVTLLAAEAEPRGDVTRLLNAWGAEVAAFERPDYAYSGVAVGQTLLIVGDAARWGAAYLDTLTARHDRRVDASTSGPLVPLTQGGITYVSSYSSSALYAALDATRDAGGNPVQEDMPERCRIHRGRILLVDDNAVNLELIQQQLEQLGYAVDANGSAQEALTAWTHGRYVAVLTDINMPHMNGYQFTAALRSRNETLPILAVSAAALASERQKCRDAGIDDLLLKPITLRGLAAALARSLPAGAQPVEAPAAATPRRAKLMKLFVETSRRDLGMIVKAMAAGQIGTVTERIHSIKGALLMLSERELAEECRALEAALLEEGQIDPGEIDVFAVHLEVLMKSYEAQLALPES